MRREIRMEWESLLVTDGYIKCYGGLAGAIITTAIRVVTLFYRWTPVYSNQGYELIRQGQI